MAKKLHIEASSDYHYSVIGIASGEPIFKVCWSINQAADLNLSRTETERVEYTDDPEPELKDVITLFGAQAATSQSMLEYYEDTESAFQTEFALFENGLSNLPKEISVFRYFFLIRSAQNPFDKVETFITSFNQADFILSAVEITQENNINKIIP